MLLRSIKKLLLYNIHGQFEAETSIMVCKGEDTSRATKEAGSSIPCWTSISHEKLCFIANYVFDGVLEVFLLSDGVLEKWIEREVEVSPKDSVYQITSALSDLKMEFTPGCPLNGVENSFSHLRILYRSIA